MEAWIALGLGLVVALALAFEQLVDVEKPSRRSYKWGRQYPLAIRALNLALTGGLVVMLILLVHSFL